LKLASIAANANRNHRQLYVTWAVAVLLAIAGTYLWRHYQATHSPSPVPSTTATVTHSTDSPDETHIAPTVAYQVAKDKPRDITIDGIGVSGIVQKVGIDQNHAVAVPSNVSVAGWYALGPRPGDSGVSLIDGHVSGKYAPGIFKNLDDLRSGQKVRVTFGDNSVRTFEVVSIKSYDVAEAAKQMFAAAPGIDKQLNLITCGGRFDRSTDQYAQRVLVITKRVP
jgi:LPXTG-site transpeptidase (sortase) family protein